MDKIKNFNLKISLILFIAMFQLTFSQKKVFAYYPYWVTDTLPVEKIQFDRITHLIHAFVKPDSLGNLKLENNFINSSLNNTAHLNNVKIFISVGGENQSEAFSKISQNENLRENFATNIVNFILNNNYDGLDIDWEFPSNENEKSGFAQLVQKIRNKFNAINPDLKISLAIPVTNFWGQWFDFENLKNTVDYFYLMAYHYHGWWNTHSGHNTPLYPTSGDNDGSIDESMAYMLNRSVPKNKLVLGTTFFGKIFYSTDLYATNDSSKTISLFYKNIVDTIASGNWNYFWDAVAKVPYLLSKSGNKFLTYDNPLSIAKKTEYVIDNNFGGIMIWALSYDLLSNDTQPMLTAIHDVMVNYTEIKSSEKLPAEFELFSNYPNPFNPTTIIEYKISEAAFVKLTVYNSIGQEVSRIVDEFQIPGHYKIKFDGSNLSSGVYFYCLQSNNNIKTKSMILQK